MARWGNLLGAETESEQEIECDKQWGVIKGRVGDWQTFRLIPGLVRGEGQFVAIVRKAMAGGRSKAAKGRKTLFTAVSREGDRELQRWLNEPNQMQRVMVGDRAFAYWSEGFERIKTVAEALSVVTSGVEMGQIFKGELKPAHSLAMFEGLNREATAVAELTQEDALQYLRRQEIGAVAELAEGVNLVTHNGLALGWTKRVGGRTNNMYPQSLRILNK